MRKSKFKFLLIFFLALGLSINLYVSTFASAKEQIQVQDRDDTPKEVKDIVAKLISFYGNENRVDIIKYLSDLKEISPEYYEIWNSVFNYWDWIESDMVENIGVAPDGIQDPKKHAFIVLGFALNEDGTMTDELVGRLEVAKASAEKYPDSYVLVTGGVEKSGWTEGRRMRDWLVENGIAEDRIIVEEKAPDTAGNATNSFDILYNDYDVNTVSLITSQYHLKRGSILYYTESLLKAKELGVEPIKFIGEANAGWYRADKTSEPLSAKSSSLRLIARVPDINVSEIAAIIQGIQVIGKMEYIKGEDSDITVKSIDDKNYNVDLTKYSVVSGFDTNKVGESIVKVSYVQNNEVYETSFKINVLEHKAIKVEANDATYKEEGNIEYWYCEECGKYFSDEKLTKEINKNDTIIPVVEQNVSPKTGDESNIALLATAIIISFGAIKVNMKMSFKELAK